MFLNKCPKKQTILKHIIHKTSATVHSITFDKSTLVARLTMCLTRPMWCHARIQLGTTDSGRAGDFTLPLCTLVGIGIAMRVYGHILMYLGFTHENLSMLSADSTEMTGKLWNFDPAVMIMHTTIMVKFNPELLRAPEKLQGPSTQHEYILMCFTTNWFIPWSQYCSRHYQCTACIACFFISRPQVRINTHSIAFFTVMDTWKYCICT